MKTRQPLLLTNAKFAACCSLAWGQVGVPYPKLIVPNKGPYVLTQSQAHIITFQRTAADGKSQSSYRAAVGLLIGVRESRLHECFILGKEDGPLKKTNKTNKQKKPFPVSYFLSLFLLHHLGLILVAQPGGKCVRQRC